MSKRQVLMLIGAGLIFVFLMPGFPDSFKKIIAVVLGLLIIFVAHKIGAESRRRDRADMPFDEIRRESTPYPPASSRDVTSGDQSSSL